MCSAQAARGRSHISCDTLCRENEITHCDLVCRFMRWELISMHNKMKALNSDKDKFFCESRVYSANK